MITALNVGNNILERAFAENIDITPMKLQRLIYFVYRDYLQQTNNSLFNERFKTWKHGPVLSSVYEKFKKYGANAIRSYAIEGDGKTVLTVNEDNSPAFKRILDNVWKTSKNYNGIYLSSLTNMQGSAWYKAVENDKAYCSDKDIKVDFSPLEEEISTLDMDITDIELD